MSPQTSGQPVTKILSMGEAQDRTKMQTKAPSQVRLSVKQVALLVASCLQLWLQTASCLTTMNLPDGIESMLGFVPKSSFKCERDGYFGDTDNDCRIFHLCQKQINSNGRVVSSLTFPLPIELYLDNLDLSVRY